MADEIERKFKISHLPHGIKRESGVFIRQGYVCLNEDAELRVREKGNNYFLTFKSGEGLVRPEWEVGIPIWVFEGLWLSTRNARIYKRRYKIAGPDGLVFEIDVFEGQLRGLVILEVEFPTKEAADRFELPPEFNGIEVTEDDRYKNKHLAVFGRP